MNSIPGLSRSACLTLLAAPLLLARCSSIGPGTVGRDRFDYSRSVSDSWKRQALLNIVKLYHS